MITQNEARDINTLELLAHIPSEVLTSQPITYVFNCPVFGFHCHGGELFPNARRVAGTMAARVTEMGNDDGRSWKRRGESRRGAHTQIAALMSITGAPHTIRSGPVGNTREYNWLIYKYGQ
jgi:hypothetical protein